MIRLVLQDSFSPVTSKAIDAFARKFACIVPDEVSRQLQVNNGGNFAVEGVLDPQQKGQNTHSMNVILGIDTGYEYAEVGFFLQHSRLRRESLLPIATDPGGNLFVITTKTSSRTSGVYFWDSELDRIRTRVANSYSEVIENIFVTPEREAEIRGYGDHISKVVFAEVVHCGDGELRDLEAKSLAKEDRTLLMTAAAFASKQAIEILLSRGFDPSARNSTGIAPLHLAARNGSPDCVKLLIKNGANVNIEDGTRMTPLDYAIRRSQIRSAKELLLAGADPRHISADGIVSVDRVRPHNESDFQRLFNSLGIS